MLERQGYSILAATGGRQALDLARSERPDLILLDIMMPDMDGLTVIRLLRADPETQNVLIIIFTSKNQTDDKLEGFGVGADDYLTKPTQPREILAHVKAVLSRKHLTPPYSSQKELLTFSIGCEPDQRIRVSIFGEGRFRITTKDILSLDETRFSRHSENIRKAIDWRFYAREIGADLFRRIFKDHDRVMSSYYQAQGKTSKENLHISIEFWKFISTSPHGMSIR